MTQIPESVRKLALNPFTETLPVPGWQITETHGVSVILHRIPVPQIVDPGPLTPDGVESAVAVARDLVRGYGREKLLWLVGPAHPWLGAELERNGLVNQDTDGFEAVENAMALVEPPVTKASNREISVVPVETFEQFSASHQVAAAAFELSPEMVAQGQADERRLYADYIVDGNPAKSLNAVIDGRVVGTATYVLAPSGINLFGGSVLPDARGRGVYRALTMARWEIAAERGTPALTIQAGRMSKPIVESLGFQSVDAIRVYVDDLSGRATPAPPA